MRDILTIYLKEMREVLRDRRTLIFMIVLPTVVLPVIFDFMISFTTKQVKKARTEVLTMAVIRGDQLPELVDAFREHEGFKILDEITAESEIVPAIQDRKIKFGLVFPEDANNYLALNQTVDLTLHYNNASVTSSVVDRTQDLIDDFNRKVRENALKGLGVATSLQRDGIVTPAKLNTIGMATKREIYGERLGGFLPYFFIIFCFLGSLYPAIDIGAGEKERGTLETLLLTPVKRSALVLSKFLVVFSSGLVSSMLTVGGLAGWILLKGDKVSGVAGEIVSEVSGGDLAMIGIMLIPVAAIFASILLSISIYARSFKEAQSYAAPFNMAAIMPVVIAMIPGVELNWKWAMVPITNVSLAIKELAKGTVDYTMVAVIFGSSTLIAALATTFCIYWFQKEEVLFRG